MPDRMVPPEGVADVDRQAVIYYAKLDLLVSRYRALAEAQGDTAAVIAVATQTMKETPLDQLAKLVSMFAFAVQRLAERPDGTA